MRNITLLTANQAEIFSQDQELEMFREPCNMGCGFWYCQSSMADWSGIQDDFGEFVPTSGIFGVQEFLPNYGH